MDVLIEKMPGPPLSADDSSKKAVAVVPSLPTAQSPSAETGCRKSSRIKAKMNKQDPETPEAKDDEKYNLRLSSLVKRVQVEQRQSNPKAPKGKSKPPPLSKYRRRTANARERMRMKDINEGFEQLRNCLPDMEQTESTKGKKEKPTKYTILSLALNYIHALRDILGYPPVSEAGTSGSATSEESDLGSDAASTRTSSVSSSPSSDEMCSNPSPASSTVLDLKDFSLPGSSPASSMHMKDLTCYAHPMTGPSGLGFRDNVTCSSPSLSDPSLSPSPPPLPLPDDCMDLDASSLCLDVQIPLSTLEDCMDIL